MISCRGLWTRTVAQYLLGWASILPTTWGTRKERVFGCISSSPCCMKKSNLQRQIASKRIPQNKTNPPKHRFCCKSLHCHRLCSVSNYSLTAPSGCWWELQGPNVNISLNSLNSPSITIITFKRISFQLGYKLRPKVLCLLFYVFDVCVGVMWLHGNNITNCSRGAKSRADKCWCHFLFKCESLMSQLFCLTLTKPPCIFLHHTNHEIDGVPQLCPQYFRYMAWEYTKMVVYFILLIKYDNYLYAISSMS